MNDIVRANVGAYILVDHESVELADPAVARGSLDAIAAMVGDSNLSGVPTNRVPNVCNVATREPFCRCSQCTRRVERLYLYRHVLVLCRDCAISRVRAGEALARRTPWFLSGGDPPTLKEAA